MRARCGDLHSVIGRDGEMDRPAAIGRAQFINAAKDFALENRSYSCCKTLATPIGK